MTTLRILAVDDEPSMLAGMAKALHGFTVNMPELETTIDFALTAAIRGSDAELMIEKQAPDVLLLDHKLPVIDGLKVLRHTREYAPHMETVMVTPYASVETAIAATQEGAGSFLSKPFSAAEIRHAVRNAAKRVMVARRARELQEEKAQVRLELTRIMGHELKAPLGAVSGYLYLLRDRTLGDEISKYGSLVDRSLLRLDQMRKLIIDMLDATRLEAGQKIREIVPVDLVESARMSMDLMTHDAEERGITVALHAPDALTMHADQGEIDMMYNNLISNAVKYNRDDGRVDVTLTQDGNRITVAVADTGIGISEADVKKLFGEFVRIKNKNTRNILGSGLGLSILKRLAELYAGTVNVDSVENQGSTFTLTLTDNPLPPADDDAATEA